MFKKLFRLPNKTPKPGMEPQQHLLKEWKTVRVFISSTFKDMQEERDYLVKRVFPELRKRCRERGVEFTEVDLRWGVTEEQTERGEVLPVCLAEIQNCRPYFIGLLGERYGWVPKKIDEELVSIQPWLKEHRERSITELEILHGVLNNPEMADHSFFYFRDPAYLEKISSEKRSDFKSEGEKAKEKLNKLRERIRKSGLPVKENYPNPESLSKLVLDDLWTAISQEFPEGEEPHPLDREATEHEAFAKARAKVYIGRKEYFERLDEHIQSDSPPLVILGESGLGKSALLSNWVLRYKKENPEDFVLIHFTGSTPKSADYTNILIRILGEIKRRYNLPGEIPTSPEKLREEFANWLSMAAAHGRLILILDGLNQLEDKDQAPDLIWLPEYVPPHVRLIVSTLPGRSLETLKKRNWPTFTIESLREDERRQLINDYLWTLYRKRLSQEQIEHIAISPQTSNPLYLKALLEELRVFGIHEEIPKRIEHYLETKTVDDLYEKVLERLEEDYQKDRPNLVGEATSLIWAARRGLTESEIIELLNVPRAFWSPLFIAIEESLVTRSCLLNFFHDYLRQAVADRYLPGEQEREDVHLRLAGYFEKRELDERKIDELPYQLAQAGSWKKLYDLLSTLSFFDAAWRADQFEVKSYWAQVEGNSPLRLVDAYRPVLKAPANYSEHVWEVAALLYDTGHPVEASSLQQYLIKHFLEANDLENLAASLGNQASILQARGEIDEAMKLHKEEERICRELGNMYILQASLGNQALILKDRGKLDESIKLHKEEERICRELGNKDGLGTSLGNQALILKDCGKLDEAMKLHKEEEKIFRELGDMDGLARSLGNQAIILKTRGELDKAMKLSKEQERICRELGNKVGLGRSFGNQSIILQARGELDKAMKILKEEEKIFRELGDMSGLAGSLGEQALILWEKGDLENAMRLLREQERICRDLGEKDGLARSLGNQAIIFQTRGELDEAMKLHKEQERICRELRNMDILQASLGNQAAILQVQGVLEEAMELHKEQERICRDLGNKDGLARSLGNQALILMERGDFDKAMEFHKIAERIWCELSNPEGLATSIMNQAVLLTKYRGEIDKAFALACKAYEIAVRHGLSTLTGKIGDFLEKINKSR